MIKYKNITIKTDKLNLNKYKIPSLKEVDRKLEGVSPEIIKFIKKKLRSIKTKQSSIEDSLSL